MVEAPRASGRRSPRSLIQVRGRGFAGYASTTDRTGPVIPVVVVVVVVVLVVVVVVVVMVMVMVVASARAQVWPRRIGESWRVLAKGIDMGVKRTR